MATPQQEFLRGRNAIVYFNNILVREFNSPYTVDQMISIIQSRPMSKNFVQGLGMGIIEAEVAEFNVKAGMESLARKGGGKIPATNGAFTQAVANNVRDNISYVDATLYVTKETAKDVGSAVINTSETIGNSLIGMGKFSLFLVEYWYLTIPVGIYLGVLTFNYILPRAERVMKLKAAMG